MYPAPRCTLEYHGTKSLTAAATSGSAPVDAAASSDRYGRSTPSRHGTTSSSPTNCMADMVGSITAPYTHRGITWEGLAGCPERSEDVSPQSWGQTRLGRHPHADRPHHCYGGPGPGSPSSSCDWVAVIERPAVVLSSEERGDEHVANPSPEAFGCPRSCHDEELPQFGGVERPQHVARLLDRHARSEVPALVQVLITNARDNVEPTSRLSMTRTSTHPRTLRAPRDPQGQPPRPTRSHPSRPARSRPKTLTPTQRRVPECPQSRPGSLDRFAWAASGRLVLTLLGACRFPWAWQNAPGRDRSSC